MSTLRGARRAGTRSSLGGQEETVDPNKAKQGSLPDDIDHEQSQVLLQTFLHLHALLPLTHLASPPTASCPKTGHVLVQFWAASQYVSVSQRAWRVNGPGGESSTRNYATPAIALHTLHPHRMELGRRTRRPETRGTSRGCRVRRTALSGRSKSPQGHLTREDTLRGRAYHLFERRQVWFSVSVSISPERPQSGTFHKVGGAQCDAFIKLTLCSYQAYLVTLADTRQLVARVAQRFMPRLKTQSEVATMQYLREMTSIPVPDVYFYDSSPFNRLGCEYILMSKVRHHS